MRRFAVAFTCCLLAVTSPCRGQDVRVEQIPGADAALVTVATPGGMVDWRNVARGIARAENLDDDAVASLLPGGTLNLNSRFARFSLLGLSVALGSGVRMQMQRGAAGVEALVIQIDHGAIRRSLNLIKGVVRQVVFRWDNGDDSRFGLFLDEDWQQADPNRPLVIVIHGYESKPEEFDALRERLRDAGFSGGVFSYPNDGPIAASGRQLAAALGELGRQAPNRRVTIIAHSMGGLVTREAIEDPSLGPVDNVEQLIMVATPNHGSNLARIPISLDVWEHLFDGEPDTAKTVLFESVADGLNEARGDLQPDSAFLERLNSFPRNERVRYSLLLGDRGPATAAQVDELRGWLREAQQRNTVLRALGPRMNDLLEDMDELIDGLGDGAVAVERGRLEGVADTVVLPMRHKTLTSDLMDESGHELVAQIMERLRGQ